MANINFNPSEHGHFPSNNPTPSGPSGSFSFTPSGPQSPNPASQGPMQLAAQQKSGNPVGEYQEPPPPSIDSAPKSPIPPGAGNSLGNLSIGKDGTVSVSLYVDIGNKTWQQQFDYSAQLTPGQAASLASGGSSLETALSTLSPPSNFTCTNATNFLTRFPPNLALFEKEFPTEYKKFIKGVELQIFQQVHAQQDQAVEQMKKTFDQMKNA